MQTICLKVDFQNDKRMSAQTKLHDFTGFTPISPIGLLKNFKIVCDTSDIYEGAALWLFHFIMNRTASTVLNACLCAERTSDKYD